MRVWQADDDLPHNSVFALAQTRDGFLWVGTGAGLARFDGVRFSLVDDPNAPELARAWITALAVAADGTLWIGTDGYGAFCCKNGQFSRQKSLQAVTGCQVRCVLPAEAGRVWVGTEQGVVACTGTNYALYKTSQGLGDNSVRALWCDQQGTLWAATKRGLSWASRRDYGKADNREMNAAFHTLNFPGGWNRNALRVVLVDRHGNLWVGSTDGLYCLSRPQAGTDAGVSRESTRVYTTGEGLPDNIINCIFEDEPGQLWVGTYGGLVRIIDSQVVPAPSREGAFGDLVNSVFADAEGSLWVGARDGLYRLTPARFKTFTTEQGLSGNNVMSVREDNSSSGMWLGIWGGGVNFLQGNKVSVFLETNLLRDSVLALCQARDGTVWVGMDFAAGLSFLEPPKLQGKPSPTPDTGAGGQNPERCRRSFHSQSNLIAAPICAICEDREGSLWIGTKGGLNRIRRHSGPEQNGPEWLVDTYGTTNGLAANSVEVLCVDPEGYLWVGTEGGLSRCSVLASNTNRISRRLFKSYTTRDGLSHDAVCALYPEAGRALWIGTQGGGLNRFRDGKFTAYTTREGLFSDEIYEILEDDFGFFWMSCRRGIFRVAKRDFDELDRGARKVLSCTAFGKADGLVSVQCNGVAKPAGWKSRDGRLWFPTIRGVVCVEARIETNDKPPPVVIEEIWADKKRLATAAYNAASHEPNQPRKAARREEVMRIPHGRGDLEIRYTALSLQAPEKNRFKYQLEGADTAWVDADTERAARYNNLGPGAYRFRVIACNNDGVWNEAGAAVSLVLLPHYWQTWWFRLGLAIAAGVLLALGYRLRIARLREIERLRVEIAANLHDDVGARLTKVAMITEQVDQQTGEGDRLKPQVRSISQTTREIIQAMDEIVWTINPRNDTLDHLANYIFQYAQEYFAGTRLRCRLNMPAQLPDLPISTEVRHNLFMAVKEALNNVLKHSAATEVRISLKVESPAVFVSIADNGKGFDSALRRGAGEGLRNMEQRLKEIGGELALRSGVGSGTTIEMQVDLK